MKTAFLAGAALAIAFSPAADANVRHRAVHGAFSGGNRTYQAAPFHRGGADPDPFIRGQLLRDIPEEYHGQ